MLYKYRSFIVYPDIIIDSSWLFGLNGKLLLLLSARGPLTSKSGPESMPPPLE